jgi:hypothetical protein
MIFFFFLGFRWLFIVFVAYSDYHASLGICFTYTVDKMHIGYWWEIQKERDHWEDQDVGGWTILKLILER